MITNAATLITKCSVSFHYQMCNLLTNAATFVTKCIVNKNWRRAAIEVAKRPLFLKIITQATKNNIFIRWWSFLFCLCYCCYFFYLNHRNLPVIPGCEFHGEDIWFCNCRLERHSDEWLTSFASEACCLDLLSNRSWRMYLPEKIRFFHNVI